MKIEQVAVESLIPYARNSRTHSDDQVAQIAASIREFGWTNPILVDGENGIIAGHGRLLAARKLKMSQVPVIQLDGMTDTQKKAYIIADNKLSDNSDFDSEMLALELTDLHSEDFDIGLIGFNADELTKLIGFGEEIESPEESKESDENIDTEYCCPKCKYEWSGKPK